MGQDIKLILPAVFVKPVFRVDRSVRLEFDTRELNGKDAAVLMDQRQKEGYLLFSPNKELDIVANIPDEKADAMVSPKTQAQRLRAVIFKIWEQQGKKGDFEGFYRTYMERVIEREKANLE